MIDKDQANMILNVMHAAVDFIDNLDGEIDSEGILKEMRDIIEGIQEVVK